MLVSAICFPCMVIICHFFGIDSEETSFDIVAEGIINDSRTFMYIFSMTSGGGRSSSDALLESISPIGGVGGSCSSSAEPATVSTASTCTFFNVDSVSTSVFTSSVVSLLSFAWGRIVEALLTIWETSISSCCSAAFKPSSSPPPFSATLPSSSSSSSSSTLARGGCSSGVCSSSTSTSSDGPSSFPPSQPSPTPGSSQSVSSVAAL
mmetsp:Transcript_22307/g.46366  ORF Transcript_22307/g.46366 Transcript_22307/m.46366 type:complete len:207 (-) Transcript_22307:89-709(-)